MVVYTILFRTTVMSISMAMIALMKNKCQQTNDAKFCVHVYLHLCFLQETQREALSCKSNLSVNLYGVSYAN